MTTFCRFTTLILPVLAFALLAGPARAEPPKLLTAKQVLEQVDEEAASEVRFLLQADCFAEGGIGIAADVPRWVVVFNQLLASGKIETFFILLRSENPAVALYGFTGVIVLDRGRAVEAVPHLIARTERTEARSGCTGYEVCVSDAALEWDCMSAWDAADWKLTDTEVGRIAAEKWLRRLRNDGINCRDHRPAAQFGQLLGKGIFRDIARTHPELDPVVKTAECFATLGRWYVDRSFEKSEEEVLKSDLLPGLPPLSLERRSLAKLLMTGLVRTESTLTVCGA